MIAVPRETRVMAVANQKGGVGKTTTTVNVGVALARLGARVLCIDLDPQGNASTGFGVPHPSGTASIYDVLIAGQSLKEVIVASSETTGLHVAPSTIDLAGAEIELVGVVARETRLKRALEAVGHDYDVVLIDCPPSLGLLTVNAMVAADEVLIPIQCEYYALEGLSQLLGNIDLVRAHLNPALHVGRILLTMYDARTRLADDVISQVRAHFGDLVLPTVIPRNVRVSEAPGFGQSVMTYDPSSRGAVAYASAARELLGDPADAPTSGDALAVGASVPRAHEVTEGPASTLTAESKPRADEKASPAAAPGLGWPSNRGRFVTRLGNPPVTRVLDELGQATADPAETTTKPADPVAAPTDVTRLTKSVSASAGGPGRTAPEDIVATTDADPGRTVSRRRGTTSEIDETGPGRGATVDGVGHAALTGDPAPVGWHPMAAASPVDLD